MLQSSIEIVSSYSGLDWPVLTCRVTQDESRNSWCRVDRLFLKLTPYFLFDHIHPFSKSIMPIHIDGSPLRKALQEGRHALGVQLVMPSAHVARIVAGVPGLTVSHPLALDDEGM